MQIRAEPRKSALPICNYSQILYQFLTFTQNLKRSRLYTHVNIIMKISTLNGANFFTISKGSHIFISATT